MRGNRLSPPRKQGYWIHVNSVFDAHARMCASLCVSVCQSAVRSTWTCIFLQLLWQFKHSVYLFRECLPVPLVYVLGNTIWPQVLSVYLKPSVSVPILIVSRVSSRLASPLIIRAMWKRQCLEREGERERERGRGTYREGENGVKTRANQREDRRNEWASERERM